jgi:DNA-binding MarR family transcriptional regulator
LTTQALARTADLETWVRFLRAHAAVVRQLNAELVAEHGLTINDYEVLLRLARAPDRILRRVDLAELVLLTPSGITRLLDGLERAGFVRKESCASDARVVYAKLTDAGYAKLQDASETHLSGVRSTFTERFSVDELGTLGELLGRLPGGGDGSTDDCAP